MFGIGDAGHGLQHEQLTGELHMETDPLKRYREFFEKIVKKLEALLADIKAAESADKAMLNEFSRRLREEKDMLLRKSPTCLAESKIKIDCQQAAGPLIEEAETLIRAKRRQIPGAQRGRYPNGRPAKVAQEAPKAPQRKKSVRVSYRSAIPAQSLDGARRVARLRFGKLTPEEREATVGRGFERGDFNSTSEITTFG